MSQTAPGILPDGLEPTCEIALFSPQRDYSEADEPIRNRETKRREYAMAGIPEYWLIDPAAATVTVFVLPATGGAYDVAGVYAGGGLSESVTLPGFTIAVDALFGSAA